MSFEQHSKINDAPWAIDVDEALRESAVAAQSGLDDGEVNRRRLTFGRNQLQEVRPRHILSILAGQFKSIVTMLLVFAAILALLFSDIPETVAILAVIVLQSSRYCSSGLSRDRTQRLDRVHDGVACNPFNGSVAALREARVRRAASGCSPSTAC